MLKLGSTAFKIAAAGMMALSVAACGTPQPYNPDAPAPAVESVLPAKSLERLTNQNVIPVRETDGIYRMTLDGKPYGRDGDIPCAVVLYNHGLRTGWGTMSCDWEAAPRIAAAPVAAPSIAP